MHIKLKNVLEMILKESIAPGLTNIRIETPEEFLSSFGAGQLEEEGENTIYKWTNPSIGNRGIGGVTTPIDIRRVVGNSNLGTKAKKGSLGDTDPFIHNANVGLPSKGQLEIQGVKYVDENDIPIDEEKLKRSIMTRPSHILDQNAKMSKSKINGIPGIFFDITIPAYRGLYVDEKDGTFKVVTTCPNAEGCKVWCFARKGPYIQFPAASLSAARTISFLMNDWEGFKQMVVSEIKQIKSKMSGKTVEPIIRWHDSGDFFSEGYLELAYSIARETSSITHYAYTKRVSMVIKSAAPENFVFNFSFGGTEDDLIDPKIHKHSRVVPSDLFKDFLVKVSDTEAKPKSEEALRQMKDGISKEYNLDPETVVSYDELEDIPYDKKNAKKKWNVLVWKGHGDTAAVRKDVIGSYLFIH
jgi:hypothetical protein